MEKIDRMVGVAMRTVNAEEGKAVASVPYLFVNFLRGNPLRKRGDFNRYERLLQEDNAKLRRRNGAGSAERLKIREVFRGEFKLYSEDSVTST